MKISLKTRTVILCGLIFAALPNAEELLHVNFDNHTANQQYTKNMARADFPYQGYTWFSDNLDVEGRGTIVPGRDGAGNALQVLYPAGEIGSASTIQIRAALKKSVDTAWAGYWVKFGGGSGGFEFVKGGKLPGLCGNLCITGGNDANGYNGWSARIMWRNGGTATQYMYYVTNTGYGEDLVFDKSLPEKCFVPETWHRVNTQIIMNTPGIANGVIRSWFDGELSMERNNILIRHIDTLKINLFYISTFFGGSSYDWAPANDMYITFDDFSVITDPASSPDPQVLYELSATSGRVPIEVTADLSASLNTGLGMFDVDFGTGITAQIEGMSAKGLYTAPGIYNIRSTVWNSSTQNVKREYVSRRFFALGERDLISSGTWAGMPLADTLRSGDTLRLYLTIVDTQARIIAGPAITGESAGSTLAQEHLFFGILQYEDGVFSALNGTNRVYIPAPGTFGTGTYEAIFVLRGNANTSNIARPDTYDLSLYGTSGNLIYKWENMPKRGYAEFISNHATWATREQAAVIHIEPFGTNNTGIGTKPKTAAMKTKTAPTVRAHKNGILLLIPASSPSAQIELFNAKGALVKRVSSNSKKEKLFIPIKSRGFYLYRIKTGDNVLKGSVAVR